jgi:hypothetical protein
MVMVTKQLESTSNLHDGLSANVNTRTYAITLDVSAVNFFNPIQVSALPASVPPRSSSF